MYRWSNYQLSSRNTSESSSKITEVCVKFWFSRASLYISCDQKCTFKAKKKIGSKTNSPHFIIICELLAQLLNPIVAWQFPTALLTDLHAQVPCRILFDHYKTIHEKIETNYFHFSNWSPWKEVSGVKVSPWNRSSENLSLGTSVSIIK